jgi:hypothetical protein
MSAKKATKTKAEAGKTHTDETSAAAEPKARSEKAADKKPKKTSALDAPARVLGEAKEPMNCQELIKAMADKGYWTSPGGKTPAATLYSAMTREIDKKARTPGSRRRNAASSRLTRKGGDR